MNIFRLFSVWLVVQSTRTEICQFGFFCSTFLAEYPRGRAAGPANRPSGQHADRGGCGRTGEGGHRRGQRHGHGRRQRQLPRLTRQRFRLADRTLRVPQQARPDSRHLSKRTGKIRTGLFKFRTDREILNKKFFWPGFIANKSTTYTSGHDYLDAERASCLMNTHWNTVWSNRHHRALSLFSSTSCCGSSSSTSNYTFFQVWGSNPNQGNFFGFFSFFELPFESHHKKLPWLGFEPQTWKCGTGTATARWIAAQAWHAVKPRCRGKEGKRPVIAHCFTVFRWVFIRQLALFASR